MTAFDRHHHPSLEQLQRWLDDPQPLRAAAAVAQHCADCERCGSEVRLLRQVRRARAVRRWELPPDHVRLRARGFPGRPSTPAAPAAHRAMPWSPTDVRSDGLPGVAGSRVVSQVLDEVELSLMASPPHGDGPWRLEGRIWLRKPSAEPIHLVLRHEDHVLTRRDVGDGEYFEIEDVVGPGWVLEVHLPNRSVLTLEDPAA